MERGENASNCVCESKRIPRLSQEKPENMPYQPGGEAYKAFIRPFLEYTCVVWDPRTQKNINRLESIQRRAARFVLNCCCNTSSVSSMLHQLQWPSLQQRRLTFMYKMHNNLVCTIIYPSKLQPLTACRRRSHSQ